MSKATAESTPHEKNAGLVDLDITGLSDLSMYLDSTFLEEITFSNMLTPQRMSTSMRSDSPGDDEAPQQQRQQQQQQQQQQQPPPPPPQQQQQQQAS